MKMSERTGKMVTARLVQVGQEVQFNTHQRPGKVTSVEYRKDVDRFAISASGLGERLLHGDDLVIVLVLDPKPITMTEERRFRK